jgi:hypothetical protein
MSPLPTNTTVFKRRFIREPDEEELEQQEAEISSEIQVQTKQTIDSMHKKKKKANIKGATL